MNLSDLVLAEHYGFLVTPTPHLTPGILGNPKDAHGFDALVCNDPGECLFVACLADSWDHVYGVSHEIAEHQRGFGHTLETFESQAVLLAKWCRRLARENTRLAGLTAKESA